MPSLTAEIAPQVIAACREGADRLAAALSQALGSEFSASAGEASPYASAPPQEFGGAGLVLAISGENAGLAAIIPASSGLAPAWCADPDEAGAARLLQLARELSSVLAPAGIVAERIETHWVGDLSKALARAGLAAEATMAPVTLRSAEHTATMSVVWPLVAPSMLGDGGETAPPPAAAHSIDVALARLPQYSRSLLKIRVPISVQLASRKETVHEVINLAPGSIIKFEKNCDELLQMIVGDHPVAEGEAVKVGDKFGFRVNSMLLPREHFLPVRRPRPSA
jgi:flagellar motor switch protein FliN